MKEKHIISMSAKEIDEFMEKGFHESSEDAQRAMATMMLLCSDYVEFITHKGLWKEFAKTIEAEQVEMH
jgi:hypothetical protein